MDMKYYKRYEPFFGSWSISKMLGEGSFGKVFEIERQDFGKTYKAALKIITVPKSESEVRSIMASGMDDASVTEFFEDVVRQIISEFVLMSKLKGNSHVVSYEDHQVIPHEDKRIGWDILIRMELLTPLLDYAENTKLTRKDIMKLGIDMCHALELCQKHNIIHRDIKPENIFISENGNYKLGDFGIARTIEKTNSGMSKKGTYTYMAPEVYKGEKYGSSVDIYSLGVVLYRLLNKNRTPFLPPFPEKIRHSDIDKALILRVSGEVPPAPAGADGRLAEIVLKACSYNPKNRYSSPMQMRQELEAILYESDKAMLIYPKGDEVNVAPNEYSSFGKGTVSDFDYKDEGTVSVFGDVSTKSIVEPESEVPTEGLGTCLSCNAEVPINKNLCRKCNSGKSYRQKEPIKKRIEGGMIVVALSFVALFLAVLLFVLLWLALLRESVVPIENTSSNVQAEFTIAEESASANEQVELVMPDEIMKEELGLVWIVEPTLEHDEIWFCTINDMFFSYWYEISKITGELTGGDHPHHCGFCEGVFLVYDLERGLFGEPGYGITWTRLFGMHSFNEFVYIYENQLLEWGVEFDRGLDRYMIVEGVDSTKRQYWVTELEPENIINWVLTEEAFTGKYAIMRSGEQMTEFIFDGTCRQLFIEGENLSFAVVSKDGYWGVVDESGNTLVPFIFDHMVSIDENTAFAKYNGYYGILDIQRLIE